MAFRVTPERLLDLAAFLLLTPGFIAAIFGDHNSERLSASLWRARDELAPKNVAGVVRALFAKTPVGAALVGCASICFCLVIVYEVVETVRAIYLGTHKPPIHAYGYAAFVQQLGGLPRVLGLPILAVIEAIVGFATGPAFFLMLGAFFENLRHGTDQDPLINFDLFEFIMSGGCGFSIWWIVTVPAFLALLFGYFAASLAVNILLLASRTIVGVASLLMQLRWRRIAFIVGVALFVAKDLFDFGPS